MEEKLEKGCLAVPPGLHHMRDVEGERTSDRDGGVGVHAEEIQLNYARIESMHF